MRRKRIILSVINDLVGDQRIHRVATALQEAGFDVLVIGRLLPDSLPLPNRTYSTHRMRLFFSKGKLFYLEYNARLFVKLWIEKVDLITANDLDTLLANFLVSRMRGKRLIYDSHEYFTEVPELIGRTFTRKIWLALENWIFPKLKTVYTVNASIAQIYQEKYQTPVHVIRNVPIPVKVDTSNNPHVLIYQGALNVGRGIELMIDSMELLKDHELWIVGKGDVETELKRRAAPLIENGARIIFKGFVPPGTLKEITAQAGIGLSLEEELGLNYRYASPNKVYDYLQAGLPVLVSDLPEMSSLVRQYRVGEVLESTDRTPAGLARQIRAFSDTALYENFRKNAYLASQELNWEQEKAALIHLYKNRLTDDG